MRKFIILSILCLVIGGPLVFVFMAMESTPLVKTRSAGNSADAARTRKIVREFLALTEASPERRKLRISQSDINSIMKFAVRAVPSLRGSAKVSPDAVRVASSVKVPGVPGGGWLNVQMAIEPSQKGLNLASVKLGSFDLPAGLVLPVMRIALDLVFGNEFGTIATTSIDGVAIDNKTVVLGIALTGDGRTTLTSGLKSKLRNMVRVSNPEEVRTYYLALDDAVTKERIRSGESVVAYLRLTMKLVREHARDGEALGDRQAALLALAIYCGHIKFEELVGDVVPKEMRRKRSRCAGATLGRRGDLRQHFAISAGLKVVSNAQVAFTIGEFKELLDSNRGGSGFSFDDLAADRAGIRFAAVVMKAKLDDWQGLIEKLTGEKAIFPSIAGLPAGLSKSEFERRYGDVDSAAYQGILEDIEARIDRLAFFTTP